MSDDTVADAVREAFEQADKKEDGVKAAVEALEPTKQDRDESGKFLAKEKPEEEEVDAGGKPMADKEQDASKEAPIEEPVAKDGDKREILVQDKAPSSWTPKVREEWATLPESVRTEILRREEDSIKGVQQMREQMAPYTQFAQTLDPFIKEAYAANTDPGHYIGNVMAAERRLRIGSPAERFNALVEIAEGYGIPLRKVINESVGQEIVPELKPAIPPEIQKELDESRQFRQNFAQSREQEANSALQKEIDLFKKDKEFFDDVVEDMAVLLQGGRAKDLQDAYDKAIRLHPEIEEILAERRSTVPLSEKQKAAAKLKGTSSNSAEAGREKFDDDDDLGTTIRKAMAEAHGRI